MREAGGPMLARVAAAVALLTLAGQSLRPAVAADNADAVGGALVFLGAFDCSAPSAGTVVFVSLEKSLIDDVSGRDVTKAGKHVLVIGGAAAKTKKSATWGVLTAESTTAASMKLDDGRRARWRLTRARPTDDLDYSPFMELMIDGVKYQCGYSAS